MTFEYRGKRILVTGGAGFIGSHLCEQLLKAGAEVLCVDNYFTGRRENIAHLLNHPLFEAMRHEERVWNRPICTPVNAKGMLQSSDACP